MDFKKMAETYTKDSKESSNRRGALEFLDGPNKHAEDADRIVNTAMRATESHDQMDPIQAQSIHRAAMERLEELGWKKTQEELLSAEMTPFGALSAMENDDALRWGRELPDDFPGALEFTLASHELKENLLPLALSELYNKAKEKTNKKVLDNLDGLLGIAEKFEIKTVGGRNFSEFRSDALYEIRKSTTV